ncbi:MAG: peptidase and matrixin and adamalysin, partial [Rubritepida sp.]|nr:peptidase and matrixin and adamalysin [Rubritepida sp.]
TVQFLNDAWGGTSDTDRNLHVESVLVNGAATGQQQTLFTAGEATFSFGHDVPTPDVLRVSVSEDAWGGDAAFLLFVDGVQMGQHVATASHAAGEASVLEFHGDFGGGGHELAVRFLNDAWGGTAGTDRNLYVEKVELNGADQHHQAALMTSGDAIFAF